MSPKVYEHYYKYETAMRAIFTSITKETYVCIILYVLSELKLLLMPLKYYHINMYNMHKCFTFITQNESYRMCTKKIHLQPTALCELRKFTYSSTN